MHRGSLHEGGVDRDDRGDRRAAVPRVLRRPGPLPRARRASRACRSILVPDERYPRYRRSPDWIERHVFPGCLIPSLVRPHRRRWHGRSRLTVAGLEEMGTHYAETLRCWRERFHRLARRGSRARLRRAVRPDVGLLPRLLRGGLPGALAPRRPDRAHPMSWWALLLLGWARRRGAAARALRRPVAHRQGDDRRRRLGRQPRRDRPALRGARPEASRSTGSSSR